MSLQVGRKAGLWLPGQGNTANGLTILVPPGHGSDRAPAGFTCAVPVEHGSGRRCGARFTLDQQDRFERHVVRCALAHDGVIHGKRPSVKAPILTEEAWDPEIGEHLRKVGARMLAEGRWELKPNERAGFS